MSDLVKSVDRNLEDDKNESEGKKEESNEDVEAKIKATNKVEEEKVNVIKVKYSLNKVKNLAVAKTNSSRPVKIEKLVIDDQNIKYEMNSGLYLHVKEDMMQYKNGAKETSTNEEITIEVCKNSAVEDKDENNPETQIKMSVTNNKTNETTKVVLKLYHTNQSIHLQGGRRMGNVTSTSLMAEYLEIHWKKSMLENRDSIIEANMKLKAMLIKRGMNLRTRTNSGDNIFNRARTTSGDKFFKCDKCNYTCSLKHQLVGHKMRTHGALHNIKPIPKSLKRKTPPNKSPEYKKIKVKVTKKQLATSITTAEEKSLHQIEDTKEQTVETSSQCNICGLLYKSDSDMGNHMTKMHIDQSVLIKEINDTNGKKSPEPITIQEVDNILTDISKIEERKNDEKKENEEFVDTEKDNLYIEAENWRKTARDLNLDLLQAQTRNEKLVKEKLGIQEDYASVAKAAGHLQQKVHTLEEELKELKLKSDLDMEEKDKSDIALENLQRDLDLEAIPKCPICSRRFPNTDILKGHIDITHEGHGKTECENLNRRKVNVEEMEHSEQTGYGNNEEDTVSVQCKKCDEKIQNNQLLKMHMRKHTQKKQKVFKCTNCIFETPDEASYLNHIVDTHSTVHDCKTCKKQFPKKEELIAHIVREHRYTTNDTPQTTSIINPTIIRQQPLSTQIKCFDCGTMFSTRDELMSHRKVQHWKTKLCPYYHGTGRGCRFPDRVCLNIHRFEEQQQSLRQGQGALGQEVRTQVQEASSLQEVSWARVAGGQVQFQGAGRGDLNQGWGGQGRGGQGRGGQDQGGHDQGGQATRLNIDCRDGLACHYYNRGICRYRHFQNQNSHNHNQANQGPNQTNQSPNQPNQGLNQTDQCPNQPNQGPNQTNQSPNQSDSSFNMQEMKATLDNLVKVVYNLKSRSDFPNVGQSTPTQ